MYKTYYRQTGLTIMEYILKTRLELAKQLLTENTLSISEVSEASGFSSISYFCRVFKENTGINASGYRRFT